MSGMCGIEFRPFRPAGGVGRLGYQGVALRYNLLAPSGLSRGAPDEVQWSTTSDFATITGSATSASASDYVFSGLVPGTQYWSRVRPLRGGVTEQWSDPATRIAPV